MEKSEYRWGASPADAGSCDADVFATFEVSTRIERGDACESAQFAEVFIVDGCVSDVIADRRKLDQCESCGGVSRLLTDRPCDLIVVHFALDVVISFADGNMTTIDAFVKRIGDRASPRARARRMRSIVASEVHRKKKL